MDQALEIVIEMNELILSRFKHDLQDVTREEADWRPLPQANSINLILRHLLLEAHEHLARIDPGAPRAAHPGASISLDFERNLKDLEELYSAFLQALRQTTQAGLHQLTVKTYPATRPGRPSLPAHLLGYHQALHLAGHLGQISTIRNLYRKTRGEPARFFPENPNFPLD
jgi:uncharacterized damage-inducible protein DinB